MLSGEEQLKEWDRVVAMCKGTKFEGEEYSCVKRLTNSGYVSRIFAIAIVDDTPIWLEEPFILYQTNTNLEYSYRKQDNKLVGVYRDSNNYKVLTAIIPMENVRWDYFTLTKPLKYAKNNQMSLEHSNDSDSKQVGGSHYKDRAIQPWAYMEANYTKEEFVGFLRGNAHKYLARYKDKNGIEDLKKAIHYIEKLIQVESK